MNKEEELEKFRKWKELKNREQELLKAAFELRIERLKLEEELGI